MKEKIEKPKLLVGEHWTTYDGREVFIVKNQEDGFVRVLNDRGMLEVIFQTELKERHEK